MATGYTTSTAARHAAPAGAGGGYKMETIDNASTEVKQLIAQLNRVARAQTLEEHSAALQGFDEDLVLDTPFIQIQGRERVRVLTTLAKLFLGHFEIEPKLVKISVPEGAAAKGGILDVDGIVHWMPHRPWWLPLSLLLPKDLPIFADVSLGVKAHNDKVYMISGKNHNLPHVPRLLRVIAGSIAGMAVSVAEPIYFNAMDWYKAGIENVSSASTTVRETAGRGTEFVKDTATTASHTISDVTQRVTNPVAERVGPIVDKVAESVGLKTA